MSPTRISLVIAGSLLAAGLSLAPTLSYANNDYFTALTTVYPGVTTGCGTCHTGIPSPRNAYGQAFEAVPTHDSDPQGALRTIGPPPGYVPPTTTTTTTTTTAPPTTTTTAPPTTTTAPPTTTTTAPPTTTTTAPPTTTTTAPPTTTTTARPTTTTAPTTTSTVRATTTTTRPTTTTTSSTTTTTLPPSRGALLYEQYCFSCHDDKTLPVVYGARTCSIINAIYGSGNSVFPEGVPDMQFLQTLRDWTMEDMQDLEVYLNSFDGITGEMRYITACAGCHGVDARGGRVGESVRNEKGKKIFEAIRKESEMEFLGCLPVSDVWEMGQYLEGLKKGKGRGHDDDHHDDERRRRRRHRD